MEWRRTDTVWLLRSHKMYCENFEALLGQPLASLKACKYIFVVHLS